MVQWMTALFSKPQWLFIKVCSCARLFTLKTCYISIRNLASSMMYVLSYPVGERFCWISNGRALLTVLGGPVAIILLFNVVALTFTLVSIWKVQKVYLFLRLLPSMHTAMHAIYVYR